MGLMRRAVMNGYFRGKVVLVTGAASGLGRALAVALAHEDASLVIADINEAGLSETAAMVEAAGARCMARRVDVSSREQMEAFAGEVLREQGRVDILVNNAGVGVGGELKDIPLDDFEWIVGINLMGVVYGTRCFLPGMVERGDGHIVNVGSLSGQVVLPFHIPYTTTKFAITGFTEALWAEARRHGVDVTLVCPGSMKTNIMLNTRVPETGGLEGFAGKWKRVIEEGGMEPEKAAEKVLRAVERKRFLVFTGPESYVLYYFKRFAPGLYRRVLALATVLYSRGGGVR